ncbi:sugar phosphate isomerase/epimerase [Pedobacter sp. HMWF019]|uniref:sugar phosphate isomerase/epimerase family protein n=1 Tax=Pedobacter sp. HMWF019 TaxID=2056856 RepID=UPI000D3C7AEE|nr:sugar phosphate isomerase/epimerase [Pedobacter sp. HMWF019]PTS98094.1 sugar phosphate isomerase/epimerase [Pedobacter sp. HMWF019]
MNSRRTFIKQTGLAAAGVLLMPSLAFKPSKKKVGIQLYSLREQLPKDVKGVIRKVAQTGFKEVETYGYSVKDKFWGLDAKAFKALLDENDLSAPSGHYGMDEFIKSGNAEELKSYIEAANIVGGKYITVPWLGEPLRANLDDFKKVSAKLNQAAEICKASGLKLAYHNHDFEFHPYGDSNGYQVMLKETDPNLVHFEMDLYWVVRSGNDPVKLFEAHPGRFPMWHVKDMDKVNSHINTEAGSGSIDFKAIFKEAKLAGLKHAFLEQENFAMDPYASIKKSYNYISTELMSKD